jgi:hypothetical protein
MAALTSKRRTLSRGRNNSKKKGRCHFIKEKEAKNYVAEVPEDANRTQESANSLPTGRQESHVTNGVRVVRRPFSRIFSN